MSYFNNVCLLKAPFFFEIPAPQNISDLTEICYLAGMIEDVVEDVTIPVDFINKNAYEEFTSFLRSSRTDLVGISSMTGTFNNALRLAEIAKQFDKYVVMGGYHPTAMYEDVLKSPFVDAVVVGQGEETLKELVLKGPSGDIKGLAFKEDGKIAFSGCRPTITDLDAIPHPLRRVRPKRFGEAGDDYSIDTVYTSRGCPWKCTFCANDMVNKKWRARSPENVIEELEMLHDPDKVIRLKIWDANFLTNVKRVEKICDMMIDRGLTNFKIVTETRATDVLRAEGILDKLRRVGLKKVGMGIESPNEETLRLMQKKNSNDDAANAVKLLKQHGMSAQGFLIIGHYSETVEDTKRYPEFAEAVGLRQAFFMVMTPYPGTTIYDEYKAENKLRSHDWDLYNNWCPVVETRGMDSDTLKKMQAYCAGRFWSRYSGLRRKGYVGSLIYLMLHLSMLYAMFRINKTYSDDDIKDLIFESLKVNSDRNHTLASDRKLPFPLNMNTPVTMRVIHSPGRNIDFVIARENGGRKVTIRETHDTTDVRGAEIMLDNVIKLGKIIFPDLAVTLTCWADTLKNRKKGRLSGLFSLLKDSDVVAGSWRAGTEIFNTAVRGFVAILFVSDRNGSK